MSRECYTPRKFSANSEAVIFAAESIIEQYQAQGFTLTLRQLYYQFVARALIANKQSEYKKLGSIINDARLAGRISWLAIEDRTRYLRRQSSWDDPADIIKSAAASFKRDLWADQKYYVEVWIEKDALIGVIEPACERWRLPYLACRGNVSQSEQWRAGQRILAAKDRGKKCVVLHLGDHDPSGIDMTRDNQSRLDLFTDSECEVDRLALNMDQVQRYNPPPNPAKETDSRFARYVELYGDESWELDALEPSVIDGLIERAVKKLVDIKKWKAAVAVEDEQRESLVTASERWDEVTEFLA